MKSRISWFLFFYFILSLFIFYELVYLIIIWSNQDLYNLYLQGFTVDASSVHKNNFSSSSLFAVFIVPLIGVLISIIGFVSAILVQPITLKTTTQKRKMVLLIVSFVVLIIGFYISFIGQLFYNEWNNSAVKIILKSHLVYPASKYYKNWLNLTQLWSLFGVFFGLFIVAIALMLKIYSLNIKWKHYVTQVDDEELELELTAPLPSSKEFDPNQTQTITINLSNETNKKHETKKQLLKTTKSIFNTKPKATRSVKTKRPKKRKTKKLVK